jgi:hypothetical protein
MAPERGKNKKIKKPKQGLRDYVFKLIDRRNRTVGQYLASLPVCPSLLL